MTRAAPAPTRRTSVRRACKAGAIPLWAANLATVRGACRGRKARKRCPSRWGVVRVSLDFRAERVDRIAVVQCASCGRTWRRTRVPPLRTASGLQAVRLTLILPANAHRWYSRGRWHREGDDAEVIDEATIGDLDEAARAHALRADRVLDARLRAKARRDEANREASLRAADTMARLAAFDEVNRAAELAAAKRENAA